MLRCNPSLGWNSICWCFTTIISCLAKNSKILGGGFKMMIISDSWCKNLSSRVFFSFPLFHEICILMWNIEQNGIGIVPDSKCAQHNIVFCVIFLQCVQLIQNSKVIKSQHCLASKIAEMVATKGTFCAIRPNTFVKNFFSSKLTNMEAKQRQPK